SALVVTEEQVGERAADVDSEPVGHSPSPSSLAGDRRERAGAVDLSRQLAAEHAFEPLRDPDQRVEVDARLDALAVEQVDEILGADVPGRPRSEGAAADASDRRVEHARARLERGVRVRKARVAGVVEVNADRDSQLDACADE